MIKEAKRKKDDDVVYIDYVCDYCGYPLHRKVRKNKHVSDQVQCDNCKNYLRTWE